MKVIPAGIDRNTETIVSPCEKGNAYFSCTKIRNFFPIVQLIKTYAVG